MMPYHEVIQGMVLLKVQASPLLMWFVALLQDSLIIFCNDCKQQPREPFWQSLVLLHTYQDNQISRNTKK